MGFFTVIGFILLAIFMVLIFALAIVGVQFVCWFHCHRCKHCGKFMEYRGLRDDDNNGHYLFHCTKCGAWQQIPREEFFRDLDDK